MRQSRRALGRGERRADACADRGRRRLRAAGGFGGRSAERRQLGAAAKPRRTGPRRSRSPRRGFIPNSVSLCLNSEEFF
ncbi:unnamed protein product [Coccothraustes coccothraustes]